MRVRKRSVYVFRPVMMDVVWSQHHSAVEGQRVRVIQMHGAPPPNIMGQCHIEDAATCQFVGMVCTRSLVKEEV